MGIWAYLITQIKYFWTIWFFSNKECPMNFFLSFAYWDFIQSGVSIKKTAGFLMGYCRSAICYCFFTQGGFTSLKNHFVLLNFFKYLRREWASSLKNFKNQFVAKFNWFLGSSIIIKLIKHYWNAYQLIPNYGYDYYISRAKPLYIPLNIF